MSCLWMSHVVIWWMNHVGRTNESFHTYEGIMSHITVGEHVDMNESRGTYEGVTREGVFDTYKGVLSHKRWFVWWGTSIYRWISHVHIWSSRHDCPSYEAVMLHVAPMRESRCAYEWVIPHIWMSHATHTKESIHACERFMSIAIRPLPINEGKLYFGVYELSSPVSGFRLFFYTRPISKIEGSDLPIWESN